MTCLAKLLVAGVGNPRRDDCGGGLITREESTRSEQAGDDVSLRLYERGDEREILDLRDELDEI